MIRRIWLFMILLLLPAPLVWSQTPDPRSIIASGEAREGIAEKIMTGLLGNMFSHPFSLEASSTVFGVMFQAFNMFVFAIAVLWGTYGVAAGIVQTAHEGVVLGRRLNAIWMPIRMVTGIGSLIPVFGGFSLSQAIMILAIGWGINGANYITFQALNAIRNFTPLTNPIVSKGNPGFSAYDLANALFFQELCYLGHLRHERTAGSSVAPDSRVQSFDGEFYKLVNRSARDAVGSVVGTNSDKIACMAVGIVRQKYKAPSSRDWLSFRNRLVDYERVNQTSYIRYVNAFNSLKAGAKALAQEYAVAIDNANNNGGPQPEFPDARLRSLAAAFVSGASGDSGVSGSAIRDAALAQIRSLGFLGLGAYYSMFSEANTALVAAQQAAIYVIQKGPEISEYYNSSIPENYGSPSDRYFYVVSAAKASRSSPSVGSGMGMDLDAMLNYDGPSGGFNIGQKILDHMLGGMITGTDRASSFRIIDPIISAKNLGDYLMTFGAGGITTAAVSSILPEGVKTAVGIVAKAAGVDDIFEKIGRFFYGLSWLLLIVGMALAVYIPFVPFMNWVAAMVQYVSTVVQSFVAAPFWSFAHVSVEGEGMGHRAERGYLFLMLVLFKPSLMVIAFFAAIGMVILIGSAVTWLFMPAVANVQGNSVTGIFSIIGFAMIYFIMMNTIIQGSFNLVEEISDDVIGWVGQSGKSGVGRGMDERMGNVFVMGTKTMRGDLSSTMSSVLRSR